MSTNTIPFPDQGGKNFLRLKTEYGIYEGSEVGPLIDGLTFAREHLIEGLIPPRSVNILVGESGIGKSPLAYQMGLAVASGLPFVGMPSRPGKVLLVDYENSLVDAHWIMRQLAKHLRLDGFPHTFQLWPMHMNPMQAHVEEVLAVFAPDLVIIDSLRSFRPAMESESAFAVEQIRRFRRIAADSGTSFLLVHHLRKRRRGAPSLEEGELMDWLSQAAGVRALINQTDVRLAVAPRAIAGGGLTLRGHFRTRGEVGPFLLNRKWSGQDGEPLGYERHIPDPASLGNPEQQACFAGLPESFGFGDARVAYGKSDAAANLFLQKLIRVGLVRKVAYGKYCKL